MTALKNFNAVCATLERTCRYFKEHQFASPRLDAELLLAFVCQCSRIELYLDYDKPLLPEEQKKYHTLVKKRVQGIPLAYLLGEKDFWTLTLLVEEGVLIPRPDTETLVEQLCVAVEAWQTLYEEQPCWILEMGTGDGCHSAGFVQQSEAFMHCHGRYQQRRYANCSKKYQMPFTFDHTT